MPRITTRAEQRLEDTDASVNLSDDDARAAPGGSVADGDRRGWPGASARVAASAAIAVVQFEHGVAGVDRVARLGHRP